MIYKRSAACRVFPNCFAFPSASGNKSSLWIASVGHGVGGRAESVADTPSCGGSSLFVRTGMWEVQIRQLKCCVGRHQFGELRQVWGTMSCHTAESLGSCPHHSLGVTTSVAPEPGRWHLKLLGENYSAGNCTIFFFFVWELRLFPECSLHHRDNLSLSESCGHAA